MEGRRSAPNIRRHTPSLPANVPTGLEQCFGDIGSRIKSRRILNVDRSDLSILNNTTDYGIVHPCLEG